MYLTMGLELKKNNSDPEVIKSIEAAYEEIMKWLENIYEEKIIELRKAVIKNLAEDNGFDEKNKISDTNDFEKLDADGSVQTVEIVSYSCHGEKDETRGLDLKKLGIGSYKVDAFYIDKKLYFSIKRSIVPKKSSALQRFLKIIFWLPKKIFDLVRNIFVPKKKDDEDNKEKPLTDREKHVIPKPKEISNKRYRFPEMEENKTDMVI